MDNNYSLKEVLNMINLCKYMEVDGEVVSVVVNPNDNNGRTISVSTKGSSTDTSFTFSFSDGKSFDETILPIMLKEFLNNDERLSWIRTDTQNGNLRELITTVSGNEFLIETDNPSIHDFLEHIVEKPNYYENKFDSDDEAVDRILRYLRGRIKERIYLDQLPPNLRKEMISIINSAYKNNNGRNIKNEELIKYIESVKNDISKEAYGLFVKDFNENDFLLVKDIKDYLRNEYLFDNYLDEEPYISLKETGLKLVEDGYFNIANNFPRKVTLSDLKDENLKELISSKYKSRYKFLLDEEQIYERLGEFETVSCIKMFSKYLVKATRLRIRKDAINKVDFKETSSEFPQNDLDSLVKAIKLYREGKSPSEWLSLSIDNDSQYIIKLSLINGTSKDTNTFKFDNDDSFINTVLPSVLGAVLNGDLIKNVSTDASISTFITNSGNRIIGSSVLLKELENYNSYYEEYERLANEASNNTITPYGEARKRELVDKNDKLKELDDLNTARDDNNVTSEEYKKDRVSIISDLKKIKLGSESVEKVKDNGEITFDIPEREETLPSNFVALASYFRKEMLKEKGLLSASGLKEMLNLRYQSKEVSELENAKEKMIKKEITKEKYDEIHEYYKNLLVSKIKNDEGTNNIAPIPAKPAIAKPYVNKDNNTFNAMKSLIKKYKVLLSDGYLNVYERSTNEIYDASEEERKLIEFANLWCSLIGIMPSKDDVTLGSTYAYNEDNKKLFNIIEAKVMEYIESGNPVDIDSIKIECFDNNIPSSEKLIDRLFQSSDHVTYVVDFFNTIKDVDTSIYVEKEKVVTTAESKANDNDEELSKLLSIYDAASTSANDTYNASMKIFVPKEKENDCQVIVTIGKTFNERVLYSGIFSKNYIVNDNLNSIVDKFISVNGLEESRSYEVPNTTKAGIILTGKKNNVLQFTNVPLEDVLVITNMVNEFKKKLEDNKAKTLGLSYGQKAA